MSKYLGRVSSIVIECPRCKGSGNEPVDKVAAVMTLGLSILLDKSDPKPCSKCNGQTMIRVYV